MLSFGLTVLCNQTTLILHELLMACLSMHIVDSILPVIVHFTATCSFIHIDISTIKTATNIRRVFATGILILGIPHLMHWLALVLHHTLGCSVRLRVSRQFSLSF